MKKAIIAASAAALAVAGLSLPSAFAQAPAPSLTGSNFEIDTNANLVVDPGSGTPPGTDIDWATVDEIRQQDKASGSGDDSFGNGTKEDTAVPSVIDGSIPPNKSDLKFFGGYREGSVTDGFLNLFWARVQDPSGTTNMDFELNQSREDSGNGVTPVRTVGDFLITYDLERGGSQARMSLRKWGGSAWGAEEAFSATEAIGTINSTAITAANADDLGALSPRTFGEASVSLAALFGDIEGCVSFGSAYLKSRSSTSFTSAVKDFIAPIDINLTNCGTVKIIKTDDAGAPLSGAEFTLYQGGVATAFKCTTDAEGLCEISGVPFGIYSAVETVTPPGHATADPQPVDLNTETLDLTVTLTFENDRNRGKVSILKTDDDDPAVKLAGAEFTLYDDNAPVGGSLGVEDVVATDADIAGNPCTTNAEGVCEITNILYGDYWVVETVTPANHDTADPQQAQIGVGNENVQLTFVDARHRGAILVSKTYGDSNPQEGVEFTVDGVTKTTDEDGYACFDGLLFGDYDVTETVPTGFAAEGDTTKSVTVDNKASCSDEEYVGETVLFVNVALSKIAVGFAPLVGATTDATIECKKDDVALVGVSAFSLSGYDRAGGYTSLAPGTYVCTVVISAN
jgi:hypothetical protein